MNKYITVRIAASLAMGLIVQACSSGADDASPITRPPNVSAQPGEPSPSASAMIERLATRVGSGQFESWTCTSSAGRPVAYWIYGPGTVPGAAPEQLLGMEIYPFNLEQFQFVWSITGENSVQLNAPHQGIQVQWTNIQFDSEDRVRAISSTRGALDCQRLESRHLPADNGVWWREGRALPRFCDLFYAETPAVPGEENCPLLASTFRPTLNNYSCNDIREIEKYCNSEPNPEPDPEPEPEADECEYDGPVPTPETVIMLPTGAAAEQYAQAMMEQGIYTGREMGLNLFPTAVSAVQGYNLVEAGRYAQTHNDLGPFMDRYADIVDVTGILRPIFGEFADFANQMAGGEASPCR